MAEFRSTRSSGGTPSISSEISNICAEISGYFQHDQYRFCEEARALSLTPVEHYVCFGEKAGASPSTKFDPVYYADRNPDVAKAGVNLFWHYVMFGKEEGRAGAAVESRIDTPISNIDPTLDTVFLILHEASRTGAPILGWNILQQLRQRHNVVTVFLKGGPILGAFRGLSTEIIEISHGAGTDPVFWLSVAKQLRAAYNPRYVIANSAATHRLAVALEAVEVPVVALVHEFASDMRPVGILASFYTEVSKIVFPARVVEEDTRRIYTNLRGRRTFIAPQGQSLIPPFADERPREKSAQKGLEKSAHSKPFTVIGVGTVTYRKGVDLFISVADYLANTLGRKDIGFIWVGSHIQADAAYRGALDLQIQRCGLGETVRFVGEVDNLDEFLDEADLFFISSRMDPLPNVGIDAALMGLPLMCFHEATGFSEILQTHPATAKFVARYANVADAANIIMEAASSPETVHLAAARIKSTAHSTFSMPSYVETLERLGEQAIHELQVAENDICTILASGLFNQTFCLGPIHDALDGERAVRKYVGGSRRSWPLARPFTGTFIRRPMVGFNPLLYDLHRSGSTGTSRDPFADYLDEGQPEGPWVHPVITHGNAVSGKELKVALHCHFHYPDLLNELLDALSVNRVKPDLFITTTSWQSSNAVGQILSRKGMAAKEIWTVANIGRDILCFLKDMPSRLADGNYDVVGHVHGKKSTHVEAATGDSWRNFTWQHLVGAQFPMVDEICAAFDSDPRLGLVFPEDPHLNGWDFNEQIAIDLADRLGVPIPLPLHFDFPIGTMFWARAEALGPLFNMPILLEEIPAEPVPIDGTILHALERMIPFAVSKAGFTYATTHVDGVWR